MRGGNAAPRIYSVKGSLDSVKLSQAFRAGFNTKRSRKRCALRSALSCLRNYVRVTMPAVQKALYSRFAEIGRVVLISYGPEVRRDLAARGRVYALSPSPAVCLLRVGTAVEPCVMAPA